MNFYPIVPIKYLPHLASLFSHQMVLAQWLDNREYLDFYNSRTDDFIIMDNGCCELDSSLDVGELLRRYELLHHVDILVIPDTKDMAENLGLFTDSLKTLRSNLSKSTKLMAVPQTFTDMEFMLESDVEYIGITRDWGVPGCTRFDLIDYIIRKKVSDKNFHLLGIHKDTLEEVIYSWRLGRRVTGVDSSMPYRLTSRYRRVSECRPYPPDMDMEEELTDDRFLLNFMVEEFKWYKSWIEQKLRKDLVPA